MHISSIL